MNPIHFHIIIPVYKAEQYLTACLDSVPAQTYPHFTAIAADDGSTDARGTLCDKYCKKDARFEGVWQDEDYRYYLEHFCAINVRWSVWIIAKFLVPAKKKIAVLQKDAG